MNSIVICGLVLALGLSVMADMEALRAKLCTKDKLTDTKITELMTCIPKEIAENIGKKAVLFFPRLYYSIFWLNLIFLKENMVGNENCQKLIKDYVNVKDKIHQGFVCLKCGEKQSNKSKRSADEGKGGKEAIIVCFLNSITKCLII